MNPVYDGDVDYEYDQVGNFNSIEVTLLSTRREIKAEVVDRSSIWARFTIFTIL